MKLLIDMNLSPDWIPYLNDAGAQAIHWASVGDAFAPDAEIMAYARAAGCVILTHDLDFGIALAMTREGRPSVIQIRSSDTDPLVVGPQVVRLWREALEDLRAGALVTLDAHRTRIRTLPFPHGNL